MPVKSSLLIAGLGYCARQVALTAPVDTHVTGLVRDPAQHEADGLTRHAFTTLPEHLACATHLLVSTPPANGTDPALTFRTNFLQARTLRWIGYYSTTGVYGDTQGARVTEATLPTPSSARGQARLCAENFWRDIAQTLGIPLDIMRLGGIYGPQRSSFEQLRAGTARRIVAPDHVFSRIHRDDVARATWAAIATAGTGTRILNLVDDVPAQSHLVVEYAASLLKMPPPPSMTLEDAWPALSPMARSFWTDRRVVDNEATRQALGINWLYPDFRAGLTHIAATQAT